MNSTDQKYTSRLLKGGALFEDMRRLVMVWSDEIPENEAYAYLRGLLPKSTLARVRDIYTNSFRPRFIHGSPPDAWRLAKILEEQKADLEIIRPFYYWITARAELPLYELVSDFLYPRSRSMDRQVRIEDAVTWLAQRTRQYNISWSHGVIVRVAQGILAALRDFGILVGTVRKQISNSGLSPKAFAIIAFCLNEMGFSGRQLFNHPDWRLFLLDEAGVVHLLLDCHQYGWLRYDSAGDIKRIEFPAKTFKEFSREVLG